MKSLHTISTVQYSDEVRAALWAHTESGTWLGDVIIQNNNVYFKDDSGFANGSICIYSGGTHVTEWRAKGKPHWDEKAVKITLQ